MNGLATNGSAMGPEGAVGAINVVGGIKHYQNGHATGPRSKSPPARRPGLVSRGLSITARLLTWYCILTLLLRCPTTIEECGDDSPRICKPYFQLKQAVSPHLEPYYDAYAAPYVDLARPYYGAVDRSVLTPARSYAVKYGAPRLAQAQALAQARWEKNVQPQLASYQDFARAQYRQSVAPHVDRVTGTITPYLDIARTNALQTYHELLLPSYTYVQPYVRRIYGAASAFTTKTAVPSALWAWNKTYDFLDDTVWPQLRVLYAENVEPQLVKIGQRLGRFSDDASKKPASESLSSISSKGSSSFAKPTSSVSSTVALSPSSSVEGATSPSRVVDQASPVTEAQPQATQEASRDTVAAPGPNSSADEIRRIAAETVAKDLRAWQEKYTKAADESAAEMEERIDEIAQQVIETNAQVTGKGLVESLETSAVAEMVILRRDILEIVAAVVEGAVQEAEAEGQIMTAVRRAGKEIKNKAQAVRSWRETYDSEIQRAVTQAADSHFRILGGIRDLALQKIGMKWAWMEGITYRDWAKYHQLRHKFDEWEGDLEQLVVTHPGLEAAQVAGQTIEDEAMTVAASAARELVRMKEVAHWKLVAGDVSENFGSEAMQAAAEAAETAKKEAEEAAEAARLVEAAAHSELEDEHDASTEPESEAEVDPTSQTASGAATGAVEEVVSAASVESVLGAAAFILAEPASAATTASVAGSALDDASEAFASAAKEVSSIAESPISEVNSEASTVVAEDNPPFVSAQILEETPILAGNTTEFTEAESLAPAHLPIDDVTETEPVDAELSTADSTSPSDETEKPYHSSATTTTSSIKSALFGAAAQSAPTRQPIFDDDIFDLDRAASVIGSIRSEIPASISAAATSAYFAALSQAADQYSDAVSAVSVQMHGTPDPAYKQLLSSVSSAYSLAMESASSRLDDVLEGAQDGIWGTPTTRLFPTPHATRLPLVDRERVESIAAERLEQGCSWAEEQFESAKVAVGLATPAPSTPAEHAQKMLENARHNYYAGLGVAHARYSEFIAAASSALSSVTATPTPTDLAGTLSSAASVVSESGASAASVVSENMSSAAAAGYESLADAGESIQESWDDVVGRISSAVYGAPTPTPWYESFYSAPDSLAAEATEVAGHVVHAGSEADTVTSAVANLAALASANASRQYEAVRSIVDELLVSAGLKGEPKPTGFSESVYSRLSQAFATATEGASSLAAAASETAAAAGERVKEAAEHLRDEL